LHGAFRAAILGGALLLQLFHSSPALAQEQDLLEEGSLAAAPSRLAVRKKEILRSIARGHSKILTISSRQQLSRVVPGRRYRLTRDIMINGEWIPVDLHSNYIDGHGHTIGNFVIDSGAGGSQAPEMASGLFGSVKNSFIENLKIEGATIRATRFAGGLAGIVTHSVIRNVATRDLVIEVTDGFGGGITAVAQRTILRDVESSRIMIQASGRAGTIAGLAGVLSDDSSITGGLVTEATFQASASETDGSLGRIGGLVGYLGERDLIGRSGGFDNNILSEAPYVGGLVGRSRGSIHNSFSRASLYGVAPFGECVGGLVGSNGGVISGSLAEGDLSGTENVGTLVGWDELFRNVEPSATSAEHP
jgi:hypothetical protein